MSIVARFSGSGGIQVNMSGNEAAVLGDHINNTAIHTSAAEKIIWNAKQDALAFVSETENKFLRDDNTFQILESPVGGYANNLYFDDVASDIPTYNTLTYTPAATQTPHSHTVNSSEGEKLLHTYIYPTAVSVDNMPSGVWSFKFYGKVSTASGITQIGITYFRRLADNSEVDLFTDWSNEINNTSDAWFTFAEYTHPSYTLVTSDRMGARVKAKTTHNSNVTIEYYLGNGYGAYLNNPNKIRHSQLRAWNSDLVYQHIDYNTEKTVPIDADSLAVWDSVAAKFVRTSITNFKTFLNTSYATSASSSYTAGQIPVFDGTGNRIDNIGVSVQSANHVYLMGNSITANTAYSDKLQELLGGNWVVHNKGIAGNNTGQMVARFTTDITDNADCDYVVILGGVNDVASGYTFETITGNLQSMYTAAHNAGIKVVAVTILPFHTGLWTAPRQAVLEAVNTWIKTTAINIEYIVDGYAVFEDPANLTYQYVKYDYGDKIHHNDAGAEFLATTIYNGATWTLRTNTLNNTSVRLGNESKINQDLTTTSTTATFGKVTSNAIEVSKYVDQSTISAGKYYQLARQLQFVGNAANTDEPFNNTYEATKFTASDAHEIRSFSIEIKASATLSNPSQYIKAYLYSDNAGVPGTSLYTNGQVYYGSLTTSYQQISFIIRYTLVAGTNYWIVLKQSAAPTGGTISFYTLNEGTAQWAYSADGASWTTENSKTGTIKIFGRTPYAVEANSTNNSAIFANSVNGNAIVANSDNNTGITGQTKNGTAILGTATYGYAGNFYTLAGTTVYVNGNSGISLYANNNAGTSIFAYSNATGILAMSSNGSGGIFSSTASTGASIKSLLGYPLTVYMEGVLTNHNANNTALIRRYPSGTGYNVTGNVLQITDNPTNTGTISGALISGQIDATERLRFDPRVVDGASAVANFLDTKNALSTTGAVLMSYRNSGTRKNEVNWDGGTSSILGTYSTKQATLGSLATDDKRLGQTTANALEIDNYESGAWTRKFTVSKTGAVTLVAGSATAGTAPLKLTSGTLLSSPEVGAMEFLTDSLYFTQTTSTARKEIAFRDTNYGEMYMYDNATVCVIDVANVYHAVYNSFGNNDGTLAPNRDTSCYTYKAGVGYTISSIATYSGGTQIQCTTSTTHALLAGEPITITGTTNYDGTYLVDAAGITANTFVVTKAYVSSQTGSVRRPATLRVLKTGIYHAEFSLGGVSQSANDIIKFELNRNITALDNIGRKVEWTTNNRGAMAAGLVSITANDYIWLSVKNSSGSGDVTISSCNVNVKRV